MQFNGKEQQRQTMGGNDLSLEYLNSFLSYMPKRLDELLDAVKILPKVNQDGTSECPFAEDLYVQKDELAEKVEKEAKRIQPYLRLVEKETDVIRYSFLQPAGFVHVPPLLHDVNFLVDDCAERLAVELTFHPTRAGRDARVASVSACSGHAPTRRDGYFEL